MADRVLLYLIRHGLAADRGSDYPDDSVRPLTAAGIKRLKEESRGLLALDVTFEEILTSPYTRTRETAEVIAQAFARPPRVTNLASLAVGGRPEAVISDLGRFAKRRALALVGHAPDIGLVTARLIGGRRAIQFKKGAVCCVEVDALPPSAPGDLLWFVSPRMLCRLGKPA
jgi:phosphohistidine phosphatase